jgi:hypothetical protein
MTWFTLALSSCPPLGAAGAFGSGGLLEILARLLAALGAALKKNFAAT